MFDLYPGAAWLPSPNHWVGHNGNPVLAIVMHISQGSLAGDDSQLTNPAPGGDPNRAVSTHFAIGADGTTHQYVKLSDSCWGEGIVEPGNTMPGTWPAGDPNWWTVGIEWAGFSGQPIPGAQYQAGLALTGWLVDQLGLAITPDTILGHYRISPQSRAGCPGPTFPWTRLFGDLQPINWPREKIFVDWVTGRYNNKQIWWGPEGMAAFKAFLPQIGCDPNQPNAYGWPC